MKSKKKSCQAKKKFYSSLTSKKISDTKYGHVLKLWNKFDMKTIKDYHNLYLNHDILLLADAFEKNRNNSLKNYRLCLSHYLSAPALRWDAMLNMTKVELEFISDADMYLFFEKGIRCRVSYIRRNIEKPTISITNLMN